ncbi:ddx52, partial [Symbiodinium necroappetens]
EACCVVWYPLLDGLDIAPFYQRIAQLTEVQGDALVVEFGFETSGLTSLQSSGILMTHPPQIDSQVAKSLEALAEKLDPGGVAGARVSVFRLSAWEGKKIAALSLLHVNIIAAQ